MTLCTGIWCEEVYLSMFESVFIIRVPDVFFWSLLLSMCWILAKALHLYNEG